MMSASSPPQLSRILAVFMTVMLFLCLMAPIAFADGYISASPTILILEEDWNLGNFFGFSCYFVLLDASYLGNDWSSFDSIDSILVSFDGVDYYLTPEYLDGSNIFYAGNLGLVDSSFPDTGVPFALTPSIDSNPLNNPFQILFAVESPRTVEVSFSFDYSEDAPPSVVFLSTITETFGHVVSWFGNLIDSFIGENGALSVLFPFVAIGFTIALVYIGIKLVRQFVPGF